MMMKLSKNENGFTLIEILIVVLIIGIIAALAIPNLLSAQKTAWSKTCLANCSTLHSAAELYRIQGGTLSGIDPTILLTANTGYTDAVMTSIPDCPATNTITYVFTTSGESDISCTNQTTGTHP